MKTALSKHKPAKLFKKLLFTGLSAGIFLFSHLSKSEEEAQLEKCDEPKGTLAVAEPQSHVIAALSSYNLPAPTSLLREFVQRSNCFQVVERGRAMQNIQQERDLANSGMLQQGSNMGGGQMVTADFVITPDVLFSDNDAGGAAIGAAVGSLFGGAGSIIGAAAGGVKFKEAETTLLLADTRSGLQVASAKGTYKESDWGFGGILGAVGGGAYTSTDEGKVVAGALLDNYNQIVREIKNKPSLLAPTSAAAQRNSANSLKASKFQPGEVLSTKINGAKLQEEPGKDGDVIAGLPKGTEVVYLGEQEDGYLHVQAEQGEGWVREFMLQ